MGGTSGYELFEAQGGQEQIFASQHEHHAAQLLRLLQSRYASQSSSRCFAFSRYATHRVAKSATLPSSWSTTLLSCCDCCEADMGHRVPASALQFTIRDAQGGQEQDSAFQLEHYTLKLPSLLRSSCPYGVQHVCICNDACCREGAPWTLFSR